MEQRMVRFYERATRTVHAPQKEERKKCARFAPDRSRSCRAVPTDVQIAGRLL